MRKIVILATVLLFLASAPGLADDKQSVSSKDDVKKSGTQVRPKATKAKDVPESPYVNGVASVSEEGFDFGYTPTGCTIFRNFYVRNVGTDTLDIVKIKPG